MIGSWASITDDRSNSLCTCCLRFLRRCFESPLQGSSAYFKNNFAGVIFFLLFTFKKNRLFDGSFDVVGVVGEARFFIFVSIRKGKGTEKIDLEQDSGELRHVLNSNGIQLFLY